MDVIVDMMSLGFMQRALLCGVATGVVCGVISCWITHIGWSLMGDAISHAVLPGVVISYIAGIPYVIGALLSALFAVGLIERVRKIRVVSPDTAMGIVFTSLFSLGTVLISRVPSQVNLTHVLFGNLLGVSSQDLIVTVVLGLVVLITLLIKSRDITLFCFDSGQVQALGLSARSLSTLLLVCLAVTVVVALQAVGVILSVALLIVPGATARLLTKSMWRMLIISPIIAVTCVTAGMIASYVFDISSGGSIGVTLGLAFAIAALVTDGARLVPAKEKQYAGGIR